MIAALADLLRVFPRLPLLPHRGRRAMNRHDHHTAMNLVKMITFVVTLYD